MRSERLSWRLLAAVAAGIGLLVPGFLTARVWTTLNLEVAIIGVVVSVLLAIYIPRVRWAGAIVTSAVIACPPYPYWVSIDESGRHLNLFYGFRLETMPIGTMLTLFIIASLLFAVIFWSLRPREPKS